jgi:hypothetical protein
VTRRALVGATLVALLAVTAAIARGAPSPQKRVFSGSVSYRHRPCFNTLLGLVPLAGARIVLSTRGATAVDVLDANGRFRVKLPAGSAPVEAAVELVGDDLSVRPDALGSRPYELPVGELEEGEPYATNPIELRRNAAGAANIWSVLSDGIRAASAASPRPLQPVRALWRYRADLRTWIPGPGISRFDPGTSRSHPTIHVGGPDEISNRDEYEPGILLHELGHYVHSVIGNAGPGSGGKHDLTSVHRDNPALAWSEGFADAFAAVLLNDPIVKLNCQAEANLAATPATPLPDKRRFAQYNETALAGAIWQVVGQYGGPRAGLKKLLRALHAYRRDGKPPRDARDAFDALLEQNLNWRNWGILSGAFASQWIKWDTSVGVGGGPPDSRGRYFFHYAIKGPYSCESVPNTGQPNNGVDGGLPFALDDNCLGGLDTPDSGAQIIFPYLAGTRHRNGEYTVSVTYRCVSEPENPCSGAPAKANIYVFRHEGIGPPQGPLSAGTIRLQAKLTIPRDATREIVRFDALGACTLLVTGADCGV